MSSLSHSHEPYGAASVAPMRFCCVLSLALRQRERHLVCLSCSAESATETISLALHTVPHVFHLALRGGSISSLSHFLELYGAASVAPM